MLALSLAVCDYPDKVQWDMKEEGLGLAQCHFLTHPVTAGHWHFWLIHDVSRLCDELRHTKDQRLAQPLTRAGERRRVAARIPPSHRGQHPFWQLHAQGPVSNLAGHYRREHAWYMLIVPRTTQRDRYRNHNKPRTRAVRTQYWCVRRES